MYSTITISGTKDETPCIKIDNHIEPGELNCPADILSKELDTALCILSELHKKEKIKQYFLVVKDVFTDKISRLTDSDLVRLIESYVRMDVERTTVVEAGLE